MKFLQIASLLVLAFLVSLGLGHFRELGLAHADGSGSGSAVIDAGAPPDAGPYRSAADVPAAAAPAPTATAADADVGTVLKLWRNGTLLAAGFVALYLLLAFALKLDPKHAFYISSVMTGIGTIVDTAVNGQTPNASMMLGAAVAIVAVIARGPQLAGGKSAA